MKKFFGVVAGLILPLSANALDVITTVKPIQMIATEITQGVTAPSSILSSTASPHDYSLKPSDIKRINQADVIIWFGRDLEPYLQKQLQNRTNVITLSSTPSLVLREYGAAVEHDGHNHGSVDPHFWLGKQPTLSVAIHIAEKLAQLDPTHKAQYKANLEKFKHNIEKTHTQVAKKLSPVKSVGYYVFHDAYGYFEEDHGLNHIGHFTVSPERKPGAKTLIQIRQSLSKGNAKCVFSEPQFQPAIVNSVIRGSDVGTGELDPLATNIEVATGSYFHFINSISDSFYRCLSQ
ncbi:zinc ABC transporter substrate-binding protein ZnuA [Vibrio sp.]|nr:zinc ABC transporter substrate-binding protein ZnuA [Vibrio sp.]